MRVSHLLAVTLMTVVAALAAGFSSEAQADVMIEYCCVPAVPDTSGLGGCTTACRPVGQNNCSGVSIIVPWIDASCTFTDNPDDECNFRASMTVQKPVVTCQLDPCPLAGGGTGDRCAWVKTGDSTGPANEQNVDICGGTICP